MRMRRSKGRTEAPARYADIGHSQCNKAVSVSETTELGAVHCEGPRQRTLPQLLPAARRWLFATVLLRFVPDNGIASSLASGDARPIADPTSGAHGSVSHRQGGGHDDLRQRLRGRDAVL